MTEKVIFDFSQNRYWTEQKGANIKECMYGKMKSALFTVHNEEGHNLSSTIFTILSKQFWHPSLKQKIEDYAYISWTWYISICIQHTIYIVWLLMYLLPTLFSWPWYTLIIIIIAHHMYVHFTKMCTAKIECSYTMQL